MSQDKYFIFYMNYIKLIKQGYKLFDKLNNKYISH